MMDEKTRAAAPAPDDGSLAQAATVYGAVDQQALAQAEAQVAADWQVGETLLDLYEVTGVLGEGGMGKVYKVHHKGWNTDLAVKSPRSEIFSTSGGKENFIREAETWVNLSLHPHTVSCYYVRTLGDIPRVFKQLAAMPKADAQRLLNRLEKIADAPEKPHPNVARLVGTPRVFRVRQGDWRAVFSIEEGDVIVERVAHRREVYR